MLKNSIKYGDIQITQHFKIKYLKCWLDETMSEEAMAFKVTNNNKKNKGFYVTSTETPTLQWVNTATFWLCTFCLVSKS